MQQILGTLDNSNTTEPAAGKAVSYLKRLVASFSPRLPGLELV
jgi:hypothetical protein